LQAKLYLFFANQNSGKYINHYPQKNYAAELFNFLDLHAPKYQTDFLSISVGVDLTTLRLLEIELIVITTGYTNEPISC